MDENQSGASGTHREDSFDIAVRGYHRVQVQEYMARSNQLIATLEQHLAVARADLQRAQSEADEVKGELDRVRSEEPQAKPVHEEISERLSQILKLANEEAAQERQKADSEIASLRSNAQDQAARELAEARREAEETVRVARETGERELAEARREATAAMQHAKEEADRLRLASVRQTQELLDEAQRRASAVNDVSHQRLETLTATHGEAVLRLSQIRDVLADLLDRDTEAGSLAQVVEAVVHAPRPVEEPLTAPALAPLEDPTPLPEPSSSSAPAPAAAPAPSYSSYLSEETVTTEPVAAAAPAAGDEVDGALADAELDEEDDLSTPDRLDDVIYPTSSGASPIDLRERRARSQGTE
ncbi:hypothetical protein ACIB24_22290 [Spongisporangium articulatum]|uniref:DivIVA protein n=1 Tax=Spongisporangium articulatum TaxID=3362603 RepID=A0ABW8ATY6_9ACTN